MRLTTNPKPRPTHCFGMSPEALAHYFRTRAIERFDRWWRQGERRRKSYDLDLLHNYPVPGLQRLLTPDVEAFDECYYCLVSRCYSQTLPEHHPNYPYDGLTFFRVEVFVNLGGSDPCIARVECQNVRGLRKRLTAALTALGPEPDVWGLIPANEGWRSNLEDLILHPDTSPATRVDVFRQLLQKLNASEATALGDTLLAGIRSRQPGRPGYAAKHGLYGLALDAQA